jgi:hypothetical protein
MTKRRQKWQEDYRYSTDMGGRICLYADNFVDWINLAESYHDAARATIHSFYRSSEVKVSPVSVAGFLYRHAIELTLKVIVIVGKRSEGVEEEFLQSHKISTLWQECLSVMKKMYRFKGKDSNLDQIGKWITVLEGWDEDATCFRYPNLINGSQRLPSLHELIWTCEYMFRRLVRCFEDMWNRYAQQE